MGNARILWFSVICGAAFAPACMGTGSTASDPAGTSADPAGSPTTTTVDGDDCMVARAGGGVVSLAVPDADVLDTVEFKVQPSASTVNAVIGLSSGAATSFSDLATAVRFAGGSLDTRDGDDYRADVAQSYTTASTMLRVVANVTSHTYSVFFGHPASQPADTLHASELAHQYGFQTAQVGATHLDHLNVIVDSAEGSIQICAIHATPSTGLAYAREGNYQVVPLAGDQALVGDATTTRRLDAAGHVIASVARTGQLAADAAGNAFIASVAGGTLTVDSFDPALAARWHQAQPVPDGAIAAIATDPRGAVLVGIAAPDNTISVVRFTAAGALDAALSVSGQAVAFDGDQPITALRDGTALHITRFAATGETVWTRAFTGDAQITALTTDPTGNVLFGGELFTAIDFGGGTLATERPDTGPVNGFVVKLSSAGGHVFSTRTDTTTIGGIAANAARVAVSGTERGQYTYVAFLSFDAGGAPIDNGFSTGFEENGLAGRVAIAASGRIWWNLETQWPAFPKWPYLVVTR